MLSGKLEAGDIPAEDYRSQMPRFKPGNLQANLARVEALGKIAETKGISTAQLALAWLLAQGPDVVPIAGMEKRAYVDDNARAAEIELSSEDLKSIDEALPAGAVVGARRPEDW
jgi:aryl-alcohol dehydrogenase-like predicted oxidoreductase